MSEENEISEADIRLVFGGETEEAEELKGIESELDKFVEKHGGQYFCLIMWPTEDTEKKEKYKVGTSNRVRILPSGRGVPFGRALSEVFNWMRMEQAKGHESTQE